MNILHTRPLSLRHRLLVRFSFSTAALLCTAASTSSSSSSSHSRRSSDEESRAVKVSVWWDFENCSLPSGVNVFKVAHCITSAVRVSGIKGPVHITAFGDILQLARPKQEALSATGITLTHVPSREKSSAVISVLVDLMYWVSHNPPPAHLFLISGDRDFAGILHRLRMNNYNILLACPDKAPNVLRSAASIIWHWNPLIKGESFAGKHFNQPPDGPYNSWYRQYKGVIEDPYAVVEPAALSKTHDTSDSEVASETEVVPGQWLRPVPSNVLRKISRIVNAYPKGIPLKLLEHHMFSGIAKMDKECYGHKSFFRFLLSKPNLVKLKKSNGQFFVLPASGQTSEYSTDGGTQVSSVTTKQTVEHNPHDTEPVEAISDGENHEVAASSVLKAQPNSATTTPNEKFLLFSSSNGDEKQEKSNAIIDKGRYTEGKDHSKPSLDELYNSEASGAHVIDEQCAPVSMNAKVDATTADHGDKSEQSPGFFTKILGWFKLLRKDSDANIPDESFGKSNHKEKSKSDELFLMDSFWSDIESFLNTHKGSKIVWSSKTREEIAQNLRKEELLVIQPLEENDLLHLIDLLISEKKWIEEHSMSTCPFRVVKPIRSNAESAQSSNSGRLRSIILGSSSQSNKVLEQQDEGKVPLDATAKPCWKTKDEVLADCKNLLDDMFRDNPQAINIGQFKKQFIERYGYTLDYRKLGYPKLISLLQMMPDMRVGLNFICSKAAEEPKFLHIEEDRPTSAGVGNEKNEENDSLWEELGPIDGLTPSRKEVNPRYNYESPLSEDDMSDLEEEEDKRKRRRNEEESSLLQILDSWLSDGNSNRGGSYKVVDMGRTHCKQKPGKGYSFVVDADDRGKDRLIDGILANLKKSGEHRIPS